MNIFIAKNDARNGPYTSEQVVDMVRKGEFQMSDLAWSEGMAEWRPIHSIAGIVEAVLPPLPSTTGKELSAMKSTSTPTEPSAPVPPQPVASIAPGQLGREKQVVSGCFIVAGLATMLFWILYYIAAINTPGSKHYHQEIFIVMDVRLQSGALFGLGLYEVGECMQKGTNFKKAWWAFGYALFAAVCYLLFY